jgi:hypothetical protein
MKAALVAAYAEEIEIGDPVSAQPPCCALRALICFLDLFIALTHKFHESGP